MFYKKRNKRWKRNIVTRKVTELCEEWIHSNQHDQYMPLSTIIVHYFVPFIEKWHNSFLDFSWKNRDISNIQISWNKRNSKAKTSFVTLVYVSFAIILIYINRGHVFIAHFFGQPVIMLPYHTFSRRLL